MFSVIIAGGRDFNRYSVLVEHCNYALQNKIAEGEDIVIVSGGARGADAMGERYAKEMGFECVRFPAEWDKYGKRAGYIRNERMAQNSDALIAFWDGKSRGTKNMIDIAERYGLKISVKRYRGGVL